MFLLKGEAFWKISLLKRLDRFYFGIYAQVASSLNELRPRSITQNYLGNEIISDRNGTYVHFRNRYRNDVTILFRSWETTANAHTSH